MCTLQIHKIDRMASNEMKSWAMVSSVKELTNKVLVKKIDWNDTGRLDNRNKSKRGYRAIAQKHTP